MEQQTYIPRPDLLNQIITYKDSPQIKVLTGFRRCGKSTLLQFVQQYLREQDVPDSHIFVRSFDAFELPLSYDAAALHHDLQESFLNAANPQDLPCYVFLDEIQEIDGWERVLRKLEARPNTDVYITGSNSKLLSGELATYITGRYIEIPVYPLSFKEYAPELQARGMSLDQAFAYFMRYGGMPGLAALGSSLDEEVIKEFLHVIYDSAIIRDVAQRFNLRDIALLEKLSRYILSTSGNLFSTRKIEQALRAEGVSISYTALENQLRALTQAFVVYEAEQINLRGKDLLRPQRKFYAVDNGLRNLVQNFAATDLGAQLEGIVFMELIRRGWQVRVGKLNTVEIDFVAEKGSSRQYVQVSVSMLDERVRERELKPLQVLTDAFDRLVITLDSYSTGTTQEGIRIVNALDWLLED